MSKMMVSEEMKNAPAAPSPLRRLLCWEGFLLAVTLAVFIGNAVASPYFLNIWNLSDATFTFTEKAIVVLPMAMLIIAREIDLSVASTMALSSTVMGFCAAAGVDTPLLVIIGLGVGLLCGLFNGLLVTRFNLSSIVITIGTMSLYRGITYILLGDQALNHYPESFAWFGQGYVWGRSLLSLRCLSSSRPPSPSCCIKPTLVAGPTPSAITRPAPGFRGSMLSVITWCCSRWSG